MAKLRACMFVLFCGAAAVVAHAQTFTTLANFHYDNGGYPEYVALVQGLDGNLYGTTSIGGTITAGCYRGCGNVFKITPTGTLTTLHNFSGPDGASPYAGLILADDGNFYGTTGSGGAGNGGTVFKITPSGELTTLYSFCSQLNCADGAVPIAPLVQGSDGNLYGTTLADGPNCSSRGYSCGEVFKISPQGSFTILYGFCRDSSCNDGYQPIAGLTLASDGNLYGTTEYGGEGTAGTIYKITTDGTFTRLHSFDRHDGFTPYDAPIQANDGNLYGTTFSGGGGFQHCGLGCGTIFEITPDGSFTVVYNFDRQGSAHNPGSSLIEASDGNFYGTTYYGGPHGGGSIFELKVGSGFTGLHLFDQTGYLPQGGLVQATDGNFYGVTYQGGTGRVGTVYKLSTGLAPFIATVRVAGKVGASVIILGNNLTGSTAVNFNGVAAPFTVVSDTEITATVPAGATTGSVTVTTPSGVLNTSRVFRVIP